MDRRTFLGIALTAPAIGQAAATQTKPVKGPSPCPFRRAFCRA